MMVGASLGTGVLSATMVVLGPSETRPHLADVLPEFGHLSVGFFVLAGLVEIPDFLHSGLHVLPHFCHVGTVVIASRPGTAGLETKSWRLGSFLVASAICLRRTLGSALGLRIRTPRRTTGSALSVLCHFLANLARFLFEFGHHLLGLFVLARFAKLVNLLHAALHVLAHFFHVGTVVTFTGPLGDFGLRTGLLLCLRRFRFSVGVSAFHGRTLRSAGRFGAVFSVRTALAAALVTIVSLLSHLLAHFAHVLSHVGHHFFGLFVLACLVKLVNLLHFVPHRFR